MAKSPAVTKNYTPQQVEMAKKVIKMSSRFKDKKKALNPRLKSKQRIVTDETECFLCGESRSLQKAHILPATIFKGMEYEGEGLPHIHDIMMLCPNHHWAYDHYQLIESELEKMRPILDTYSDVMGKMLKTISIETPDGRPIDPVIDSKFIKEADRVTTGIWNWWRNYATK